MNQPGIFAAGARWGRRFWLWPAMLWSASAWADIYLVWGENGVPLFSDRPPYVGAPVYLRDRVVPNGAPSAQSAGLMAEEGGVVEPVMLERHSAMERRASDVPRALLARRRGPVGEVREAASDEMY